MAGVDSLEVPGGRRARRERTEGVDEHASVDWVTLAEAKPVGALVAEAPDRPRRGPTPWPALPPPSPARSRLPHFPGLDGLRGVAVVAVLLFHGGFSWAVGGYLGVSTFFTLSGFLITSLLLAERTVTRSHRPRPGSGSGACAGSCPPRWPPWPWPSLFAHFAGTAAQQRSLGGDVIARAGRRRQLALHLHPPVLRRPVRRAPRRCCTSGAWPSRSSSTWSSR